MGPIESWVTKERVVVEVGPQIQISGIIVGIKQ